MKRDEIEWRREWLSDWQGCHWPIEPGLGAAFGIPDTHLVGDRFAPGWVEFKALDGEGLFKMRAAQRLFFRRFIPFCSRACVIVLDGKGYWAIPGRSIAASPTTPLSPGALPGARYWSSVEGTTRKALDYAFA